MYTLPDLPYDYGALEPAMSGEILELHHDKHHATYVKGSLLLGLVAGHASGAAPGWLLPCVGIGFCGAYTTFATHAVEVATALRSGRTRHAVADLGLNLALGLLLVSLGWTLTA